MKYIFAGLSCFAIQNFKMKYLSEFHRNFSCTPKLLFFLNFNPKSSALFSWIAIDSGFDIQGKAKAMPRMSI